MNDFNPEEPVIAHWPADWPGRQVVELDNLGDPGVWIDEQFPEVEEILLDDGAADPQVAEALAIEYINAMVDLAFPLPTDFGVSEEDTRNAVIEDFVGFIREWRRRTLAEQELIHEKPKPSVSNPSIGVNLPRSTS